MPDLKTQAYVAHGTVVTNHLALINATMFIATGTLVPPMDFVRPYFPYFHLVAIAVALFFLTLLLMKLLKVPRQRVIPSSLLLSAGVCAAAFSIGAIASARHASQGGYLAAKSEEARAIQFNLLNLEQQTAEMNEKLKKIAAGESSIRASNSKTSALTGNRTNLSWLRSGVTYE